jgi:2-polyprenyl-3-methyl-5-hydroxy-6-metoxy-1,4-benzoquinol methylase
MTNNLTSVDEVYFSGSRPEVAQLVPVGAKNVLDVGCGFGGLGRLLRERKVENLFGIEINPSASAHLKQIYDQHWIGNVEAIDLPETLPKFDYIIFADVLEHLVDPWVTVRRYSTLLSNEGKMIASIPNVRNLGLLYNLLFRGRWTYSDSGLLDRTHLRFFTRAEIQELFSQAGFTIERIEVNRDHYSFVRRILTVIPRFFIPDLEVCQFLILAKNSSIGR